MQKDEHERDIQALFKQEITSASVMGSLVHGGERMRPSKALP